MFFFAVSKHEQGWQHVFLEAWNGHGSSLERAKEIVDYVGMLLPHIIFIGKGWSVLKATNTIAPGGGVSFGLARSLRYSPAPFRDQAITPSPQDRLLVPNAAQVQQHIRPY
jgi:hypothetical protein